jgi:hypothetical protein
MIYPMFRVQRMPFRVDDLWTDLPESSRVVEPLRMYDPRFRGCPNKLSGRALAAAAPKEGRDGQVRPGQVRWWCRIVDGVVQCSVVWCGVWCVVCE